MFISGQRNMMEKLYSNSKKLKAIEQIVENMKAEGVPATDQQYNERRSEAKIEAYKKLKGIINLAQLTELLEKYDVGKEAMADIAGFGKVTIKRYYEGFIPAREYSEKLLFFFRYLH